LGRPLEAETEGEAYAYYSELIEDRIILMGKGRTGTDESRKGTALSLE